MAEAFLPVPTTNFASSSCPKCLSCAWIQRGSQGKQRHRLRRRAEAVKIMRLQQRWRMQMNNDHGFVEGGEEVCSTQDIKDDGVGSVLPDTALATEETEFIGAIGGRGTRDDGAGGGGSAVDTGRCGGEAKVDGNGNGKGNEVRVHESDGVGTNMYGEGMQNDECNSGKNGNTANATGNAVEGVDYLNGWGCIDNFASFDSNFPSIHITSLSINLTGPSNKSLFYYTNDLRPKIHYLEADARERVLRALEIANIAHEGQKRRSGEPFIIHPVAVASILAEMKMDRDSIIAGLLHDTVEDTPVTLEELENLFGRDVRKIVEGETKISKLAKKMQNQKTADREAGKAKQQVNEMPTSAPPSTNQNEGLSGRSGKRDLARPLTPSEVREQEDAKREAEQQKQADNLCNMFWAMTEDVRVIIVKLADRLHNLRTLQHMPPAKQKKIAKETLDFFTPLAHRLGMSRIKTELEELSFKFLYPNEYKSLSGELLAMNRRFKTDNLLAETSRLIKDLLITDGIMRYMVKGAEVYGVHKPIYTVFRRMRKGVQLQSMRDIASIQVVVDLNDDVASLQACYHVLGRIHRRWKPLPNRVKDYIAFPKPNGYQCLHTTVLVEQQSGFHPLEVHICTKEMHRIAEEGIVAELFDTNSDLSGPQSDLLLSPNSQSSTSTCKQLNNGDREPDEEWKRRTKGWLIAIREYIKEFSSSRDAVDAVRRDLLGNRVYVITPQGSIVDLPIESTPVDLAYHIHTEVGHRMIGAKVNGHMVCFDYKLQNADSVKIITSGSSPGPSSEWMGYAKSRTARQKIRQFLRARDRDNMIDVGRNVLLDAAKRRRDPVPSEAAITEALPRLATVLNTTSGSRSIRSIDDLYIAIARGGNERGFSPLEDITLDMLRDRRKSVFQNAGPHSHHFELNQAGFLNDPSRHNAGKSDKKSKTTIELGTCCHPLRDDQIVGLRDDRRNVVVVHRLKCNQLGKALREQLTDTNTVDVRWTERKPKLFRDPDFLSSTDYENEEDPFRYYGNGRLGEPRQPGCIVVAAKDCDGLLSHLSGTIARCGISIRRSTTVTDPWTSTATFAFEVLVEGVEELERVIHQLSKEAEVKNARRIGPNEKLEYFPAEPQRNGTIGWIDHFSMIDIVHTSDKENSVGQKEHIESPSTESHEEVRESEGSYFLEAWGELEEDDISDEELDYRVASLRCQQGHRVLPGEVEIDELD